MLVLSFAEPEDDDKNIQYFRDIRPREDASRLKRDANAFLDAAQTHPLPPPVLARLNRAVGCAEALMERSEHSSAHEVSELQKKGFAKLVEIAMERLRVRGIDYGIIANQVIDYWMESEAVHSGCHALVFYEPEDFGLDIDRNGELTALARIKDLYPIKPIATAATLNAIALTGQVGKPQQVTDLERIGREAEELLVMFSNRKEQS